MKVLFNSGAHFNRYNGGWTKEVVKLDKSVTTGYSILGDFTVSTKKDWYDTDKLYLDCGIGGSRKTHEKVYILFTLTEAGEVIKLAESGGSDWATDLWDAIDEFFAKSFNREVGADDISKKMMALSNAKFSEEHREKVASLLDELLTLAN